ncbi:MAG: DUF429 domain-containing protein, partial [Chloroflexota bacterium]
GLLDEPARGGRECDRLARRRLPKRTSCVFSPPVRCQLDAPTYEKAKKRLPLSIQSWSIIPKIRGVDGAVTPERQESVYEVHPELSFAALNLGKPMQNKKKMPAGQKERLNALKGYFGDLAKVLVAEAKNGVGRDDVLDAYAAAWTACRIANGLAEQLPEKPPVDSKGLRMEMWV